MARLCGCGQSDHHIFIADMNIDEYDDGSFDQLFEKYRQETDDYDEAFTLMEKEIVKGLLWMRNNGAKKESSKSRSTSPSSDGSSYAQFTHPLVILPVIPKKKRSGDQGFVYPKKSPSSYDNCQDEDDDHHHILEDEEGTVSGRKERGSGILNGVVKKNKYSKTSVADEVKKEGRQKEKRMNRTNRKRCFALEDIDEEEGMRSTSKRRKGDSGALDLGATGNYGSSSSRSLIMKKAAQMVSLEGLVVLKGNDGKAVKDGEEPISFGPDAVLVDYGNGWKLQTFTVLDYGVRQAEHFQQIPKQSSDGSRPAKTATNTGISFLYMAKILVAFVLLFVLGASFTLALENLPRLILFINSFM
ncbi:hypothetical protein D5086_024476 [Populus alba]|uniref:Uncharacterized protein n=1 Tax=Populus alba TaxID=43335 RepID=A0ACC4B5L8_POPAL